MIGQLDRYTASGFSVHQIEREFYARRSDSPCLHCVDEPVAVAGFCLFATPCYFRSQQRHNIRVERTCGSPTLGRFAF